MIELLVVCAGVVGSTATLVSCLSTAAVAAAPVLLKQNKPEMGLFAKTVQLKLISIFLKRGLYL